MSVLAIIGSIIKFWDEVVWLVKKLEKTPTQKIAQVLSEVDKAMAKAEIDDDTSEIEDIIHRG